MAKFVELSVNCESVAPLVVMRFMSPAESVVLKSLHFLCPMSRFEALNHATRM